MRVRRGVMFMIRLMMLIARTRLIPLCDLVRAYLQCIIRDLCKVIVEGNGMMKT